MTVTEIRTEALKLSLDERRALINIMLDDTLEPELPLPPDELAEFERRRKYADEHPESCIPAEALLSELRKRYSR